MRMNRVAVLVVLLVTVWVTVPIASLASSRETLSVSEPNVLQASLSDFSVASSSVSNSSIAKSVEASTPPPVDVNTAGAAELESLPGIGPALARRIIEHRKAKGPFEKIEDLLEVKGIGPKMLSRLRDRVTVSAPVSSGR